MMFYSIVNKQRYLPAIPDILDVIAGYRIQTGRKKSMKT